MELEYRTLMNQALTMQGSIGNTYSRFYNYSITNQFFFMVQGISEPVANFNTWAKLGRYPKKGSAKLVITPVPLYEKDKDGNKEQSGCFFKLKKAVFAYSDTTGAEIEIPELSPLKLDLPTVRKNLNIELVPYADTRGNTQGYSIGQTYAINPMAVYPIKTSMHELGHIVLGHTKNMSEYGHNRGLAEFQAEAVAYILMNELECQEWNQAESRAYIQGWLKDEKPSQNDIKAVFTAVNKILNAGKTDEE